ncbi:MAG: hypothetical protein GWP59_03870 [Chlamydiales bacterium]|nr:translocation/assembly module TamB [Chlamydiales bacterium]NCF70823.1 hypothetical protein [Chlamydiales bacterium]
MDLLNKKQLLLFFSVFFALFLWAWSTYSPIALPHSLQKAILEKAERHYEGSISCKDLRFSLPLTLHAEKLQLSSSTSTSLSMDSLQVNFSGMQLFKKGLYINYLNIDGLETIAPEEAPPPAKLAASPSSILMTSPSISIKKARINSKKAFLETYQTLLFEGLLLDNQTFKTRVHTTQSNHSFSLLAKVYKGQAKVNVGYSLPIHKNFYSLTTEFLLSQRDFSRLFSHPQVAIKKLKGQYKLETFSLFKPSTTVVEGNFFASSFEEKSHTLQIALTSTPKGLYNLDGQVNLKSESGDTSFTLQKNTAFPSIESLKNIETLKGAAKFNFKTPALTLDLTENSDKLDTLELHYDFKDNKHELDLQGYYSDQLSLFYLHAIALPNEKIQLKAKGELNQLPDSISNRLFSVDLSASQTDDYKHFNLEDLSGEIFGLSFQNQQVVSVAQTKQHLQFSPMIFKVGKNGWFKSSSLTVDTYKEYLDGYFYFEDIELLERAGNALKLDGKVVLNANKAVVKRITFSNTKSTKKGLLEFSGELSSLNNPSNFDYKLKIHANNFLVADNTIGTTRITGEADLYKSMRQEHSLQGTFSMDEASYEISESSSKKIPEFEVSFVGEDKPATKSPVRATKAAPTLKMNLALSIKDIKTHGKGLHSNWKGQFKIKGDTKKPNIDGNLQIKEGFFLLGNKKMSITRGNILFNETQGVAGYADITLQSTDNSAFIFHLNGPLNNLSISSPGQQDLYHNLSHLLLNKPLEQISPTEALQLSQLIWKTSNFTSFNSSISKIPERLFDTIEIYQSEQVDSNLPAPWTLKVGKYLTNRLFVSVGKDFSKESLQLQLDVQLSDKIFIETQSDNDFEEGEVAIKWKHSF